MTRQRTALLSEENLRVETYIDLLRTYESVSGRFKETFKRFGLTLQQYNVLRILYVRDPGDRGLSCQQISERLIHREPDITRLVDRLEAARWVEREHSTEDRRVVLTRLTRGGAEQVESVHPELMALHESVFAHMEDEELETLRRLLQKARTPP